MDQTHHVIDYIELSVTDLSAAKDFYDFPGGRRFIFSDDSGNRLGVWATV